jgi:DNA polymerase
MSGGADLFARYLRQRQDLGETEVIVDPATAQLLRSLASGRMEETESPSSGAGIASGNPGDTGAAEGRTARLPRFEEEAAAGMTARRAAGSRGEAHGARPAASTGEPVQVSGIRTLKELEVVASTCPACRLAETRTQVVFADGDPNAHLVVVGEAPGADEDRIGRPFVGRAGKLLDQLLLSVGLPRETVYICNVIKCRPPGNRNPHLDEVRTCSPYLRRQLDFVAPKAILAVGTFAAQTLLETTEPIGRLRGAVHEYYGIPLVPTYHPAALLRNPGWIRPAWEDLQRLCDVLDR